MELPRDDPPHSFGHSYQPKMKMKTILKEKKERKKKALHREKKIWKKEEKSLDRPLTAEYTAHPCFCIVFAR